MLQRHAESEPYGEKLRLEIKRPAQVAGGARVVTRHHPGRAQLMQHAHALRVCLVRNKQMLDRPIRLASRKLAHGQELQCLEVGRFDAKKAHESLLRHQLVTVIQGETRALTVMRRIEQLFIHGGFA
ncbi:MULTISPECIES: hypothetical protein [unclassified Rhodanobacter]|uniref:hypothetical protein n=1 Tax=unclassified Rhodanobacter TaxID=2621553 RepID=UPI001F46A3E4|nr:MULTISPECIES: hypothetical protein [unclassified Rhodanobacter]